MAFPRIAFFTVAAVCAGWFFLIATLPAAFADTASGKNKPQATGKTVLSAQKAAESKALIDKERERASRLLRAIDSILEDATEQRHDARKLPSKRDFLVAVPPWTETREDRREAIRELLDSALAVVTDAPIVDLQKEIASRHKTIRELERRITRLREQRLDAPKDGLLPGILTETIETIDSNIKEHKARITENRKDIAAAKTKIHKALKDTGVDISKEQLDLLLGSVLGGDLVRLVAAFEAARHIDNRLGVLMGQNDESLDAARRYFGMHAALFAMLLHAQDSLVKKIDRVYLKRLKIIIKDIRETRAETTRMLRERNRDDQRRALMANRKAQKFSEQVAIFYRDYLKTQRKQIADARKRTIRDLRIADNTYETVEASFQLRALIEDARASFEAIQKLEAPGFDQIFKNKQLRKEFENLTRKLGPTS